MEVYLIDNDDYLETFILKHYSGDMEGVLIKNDGGVMEGRWRDDGGDRM